MRQGESASEVGHPPVDWLACPLVESVPGKLSGAPVLVGTRMPVAAIADDFDAGMEPVEIATQFGLSVHDILVILEFRERADAGAAG